VTIPINKSEANVKIIVAITIICYFFSVLKVFLNSLGAAILYLVTIRIAANTAKGFWLLSAKVIQCFKYA
jgi:hypothetical protein